ncbi:hypothetical protein FA15DRAFT_644801 [Coprinopsis marcescibilis]|uniref:Uncharacterized protein n=1 Tax=Coprinopsis marcescibilis TaxID=230819 RepID=A0A5C3L188_COPMA|nr:hypothetical protein FA15DRAFT_644801 [Coprinopsis marcescibilis]
MRLQIAGSLLFASLFSTIAGLPSPIGAGVLDVYTPTVVRPCVDDVWVVGQSYQVVWDTSSPPNQITNTNGVIRLRNGNWTIHEPLAKGFKILEGTAWIKIPEVEAGNDYRIVLFGDSGNWSQRFRIVPRLSDHDCKLE